MRSLKKEIRNFILTMEEEKGELLVKTSIHENRKHTRRAISLFNISLEASNSPKLFVERNTVKNESLVMVKSLH